MLGPGRWPRLLLPGILFFLVAGLRIATPPQTAAVADLSALPMTLLGLPGADLPVEQAILDDLDPDQLILRRYTRPDGIPVWVVLIYFENKRRGGHDPELCYRSQGYRTEPVQGISLETPGGPVRARSFLAARPERQERVATFWYTSSGRTIADVEGYRGRLFLQGLLENRLFGVFVRISTLETSDHDAADEWNRRFVAEVARELPRIVHE